MVHLGDITKIDGHEIPEVDVIIGGSPCQDLSVAGKRQGLSGARSGLFMDQSNLKRKTCPTWEEMCQIKDMFFEPDEWVVQYHPAKEDYVNNYPYCLHLWRPIGKDFPTPPKVYV